MLIRTTAQRAPGPLGTFIWLATHQTYYSVWQSTTTIKLASSLSDALAGTPITIDLTNAGTGTHRILPVGDGVASYWDVGDEINSLTSTQGG